MAELRSPIYNVKSRRDSVRKRLLNIFLYGTLLAVFLIGGFLFLNRPQLIRINAELPAGFPNNGFSHDEFEGLLLRYVDPQGNVAYERWHENAPDRRRLDSYLAAVVRFSPESSPDRFGTRSDELAYWLYSYNAYVIRSVIANWPLASVTDVKAPIEAVTGLGFFYRQRFVFGGEAYSLYAVEHEKILESFKDPRVHFVLNCASESCPVLRPELPTGTELETLLADSTLDFVNDSRNVRVDHEKKQIVLSTIFKWYKNDFLNDLRRRGLSTDNGVIDYIADIAVDTLEKSLTTAKTDDYAIVFEDYDWSLNSSQSSNR